MPQVPVADYRLAHEVFSYEGREEEKRACYSFCMCPGGQIVPTSVNAEELCVNGTYCTVLHCTVRTLSSIDCFTTSILLLTPNRLITFLRPHLTPHQHHRLVHKLIKIFTRHNSFCQHLSDCVPFFFPALFSPLSSSMSLPHSLTHSLL